MKPIFIVNPGSGQITNVALDFDSGRGVEVAFSPSPQSVLPETIFFPGTSEEGCWHGIEWRKEGFGLASEIPRKAVIIPAEFHTSVTRDKAQEYALLAQKRRDAQFLTDRIKSLLEHGIVGQMCYILWGEPPLRGIQEAIEKLANEKYAVSILFPNQEKFATLQFVKAFERKGSIRQSYWHVVSTTWGNTTTISIPPLREVAVAVRIEDEKKAGSPSTFVATISPASLLELYVEQSHLLRRMNENNSQINNCRNALISAGQPTGAVWIGNSWITAVYQMPATESGPSVVSAHTRLVLASSRQDSSPDPETQTQ